jgi:hypothetical protein
MTNIDGPTDIAECVFANVSRLQIEDSSSEESLNLWLEVTSESCLADLADGLLYLRGLCTASNQFGTTSKTFVLSVLNEGQNATVDNVIFYF